MEPRAIDWNPLRAKLQGELITSDTPPLYDAARQVFNARIQRRPAAIARIVSDADVRDCINFCRENGIAISMRCGGHGALGYAVEDNQLMIDMTGRQYVKINMGAGTVEVGGGTLWGQVDLATYSRGLASPGGGCPSVGVGGLAQGGGFGPLARTYGLTLDNIVEAEIVLADGRQITISERHHPEIFWALRGGGGGNLGVVTKFVFRLYPIEGPLAAGTVIYNWDDAGKMLQVYRDWMRDPSSDERLTMMPGLGFGPDGAPIGVLGVFYNGDAQIGQKYIQQNILKNLPQPAAPVDLGPMTLPAYNASEATTAWPGLGQYWRSGFLKNDFPDEAISTMMTWLAKAPLPPPPVTPRLPVKHGRRQDLTFCFIESLGGAIARKRPTDTAFVHRNSLFSFTFIGVYPPDQHEFGEATRVWSAQFRQAMEPYLSGGVYVNYMQDDLANWQQAYYGENYARLRACKQSCDPGHLFRFPQDLLQDQSIAQGG